MEQNCVEQVMNDVVRVALVRASVCDLPVPFQVPGIVDMAGTKVVGGQTVDRIGSAVLSVAMTAGASDDGEIDETATLRQTEKNQQAGKVITHDLQVVVTAGHEAVRTAVNALTGRYFHAVLTTQDGSRYLLYALPNTSVATLDEQDVNKTSTLKVSIQSMSHVIRLS